MTIYATAKRIYNRRAVMFKLYTSKDFLSHYNRLVLPKAFSLNSSTSEYLNIGNQ
jgi:hypothetical protein